MKQKSKQLRELVRKPGIAIVPGAFNAFVAKLIEQQDFPAVYVTGSGTSLSLLGLPDIGLMTITEMLTNVKYICESVDLPVFADADTGGGNAVNVTRTVKEFICAGAAGVHIEDQESPKKCGHYSGKTLISTEEMVGKIKAALDTRDKLDPDFVIIARTDARGAQNGGVEELIARAKAYENAGADMIFADGLTSDLDLEILPKTVHAPLLINMVEGGLTPLHSAKQLEKLGYKIVIFPNSILRRLQRAATELLVTLKKTGSTSSLLDQMVLFPGPHELVGLKEYKSVEKKYLPAETLSNKYKRTIGV